MILEGHKAGGIEAAGDIFLEFVDFDVKFFDVFVFVLDLNFHVLELGFELLYFFIARLDALPHPEEKGGPGLKE